jgi:hypothetical protein
MTESHAVQTQLEEERLARQNAVDQARRLQRDVEQLRHDAQRRENELATALLALSVYDQDQDVQDLVEHNIALREQVQSLKAMVEQSVLHYSPSHRREVRNDRVKRDGSARTIDEKLNAPPSGLVESLVRRLWKRRLEEHGFSHSMFTIVSGPTRHAERSTGMFCS